MKKKLAVQTRNLSVTYNGTQAVKNITLSIAQERITALIGASGSGKTSFLRVINRIIDVFPLSRVEGKVKVMGQDIYQEDTDVITLRRQVGMVFQSPVPFPRSIYDNIAYGLELEGLRGQRTFWQRLTHQPIDPSELELSENPINKLVVSSLKQAALWDEVKHRLHQSAYRLSGGQQQRLCIARAIALQPEILLLDEPCSALDPISTHKIEQLLLELKRHYTIIIVTHNLQQARRISDYVVFFHLGELVESGTVHQIFEHPRKKMTRNYVQGEFG